MHEADQEWVPELIPVGIIIAALFRFTSAELTFEPLTATLAAEVRETPSTRRRAPSCRSSTPSEPTG